MFQTNVSKGQFAENLACRFLMEKGCRVLDRNYRTPYGEVDIIFEDNSQLVFGEVKSKFTGGYGTPEEEFNAPKYQKFNNAVLDYLSKMSIDHDDYRIDLIAMELDVETKTCKIRHYKAYY